MGQTQTVTEPTNSIIDHDIKSTKELIRFRAPFRSDRKILRESIENIGVTVIQNRNEYILWSPLDKSERVYDLLSDLNVNWG